MFPALCVEKRGRLRGNYCGNWRKSRSSPTRQLSGVHQNVEAVEAWKVEVPRVLGFVGVGRWPLGVIPDRPFRHLIAAIAGHDSKTDPQYHQCCESGSLTSLFNTHTLSCAQHCLAIGLCTPLLSSITCDPDDHPHNCKSEAVSLADSFQVRHGESTGEFLAPSPAPPFPPTCSQPKAAPC